MNNIRSNASVTEFSTSSGMFKFLQKRSRIFKYIKFDDASSNLATMWIVNFSNSLALGECKFFKISMINRTSVLRS